MVSDAVLEKRKYWIASKKGGSNDQYLVAKRKARKAVYDAKRGQMGTQSVADLMTRILSISLQRK